MVLKLVNNRIGVFLILILIFLGCQNDDCFFKIEPKTKNIIIVLIDGPRYSETWGDSSKANIPYLPK